MSSEKEVIPPEINELNTLIQNMISGENVSPEDFNKCCLNINERSRSLFQEHVRLEKQNKLEMERRFQLQKQVYDQRINFVLDSCQIVAGNSLATRLTINQGQVDNSVQNLQPSFQSPEPVPLPTAPAAPAAPAATAEPVIIEEALTPAPSVPLKRRRGRPRKYPLSTLSTFKVITKLPKEKHGFNTKRMKDGQFFCLCGQELSSKYNLRRHIKLQTQNEKLFKCGFCPKNFLNLYLLKKHQKSQHQIQNEQTKGTIGCSGCGKVFANHLLHRRHRQKYHKHE